jgi:hypothetical protein
MAHRYQLTSGDSVHVADLRQCGNLFWKTTEDGDRIIVAPARGPVIRLETRRGDIYEWVGLCSHALYRSGDFAAAERMAARMRDEGSVNLEMWGYVRTVYGSRAYSADGHEEAMTRDERDEAMS